MTGLLGLILLVAAIAGCALPHPTCGDTDIPGSAVPGCIHDIMNDAALNREAEKAAK